MADPAGIRINQIALPKDPFCAVSEFFLYFRCWPGFTDSFPFKEFNGLSDADLNRKLNELAEAWLRDNKESLDRLRRRKKREVLKEAKRNQRQFTIPPTRRGYSNIDRYLPVSKSIDPMFDQAHGIGEAMGASVALPAPRFAETAPFTRAVLQAAKDVAKTAPLFVEIASYAHWIRGIPIVFSPQLAGPLTWFLSTPDAEFAAQLITELSNQRSLDYERFTLSYELNPRYGYVPESSFPRGGAASVRRAIEELKGGKPLVLHTDLAIAVAKNAWSVAGQLAASWPTADKKTVSKQPRKRGRKVKYSPKEDQKLVDRLFASGMRLKVFASKHGINPYDLKKATERVRYGKRKKSGKL